MAKQTAERHRTLQTESDRDGDTPDLGTCCGCGGSINVRNIIMLDKRATVEGFGWGCFQCGLPMAGAVAVLCDACLGILEPKFACVGYPSENKRVPVEELTEAFEHDMSKHPRGKDVN